MFRQAEEEQPESVIDLCAAAGRFIEDSICLIGRDLSNSLHPILCRICRRTSRHITGLTGDS